MHPEPVFFARGSRPPVSNTERQRRFRERNPGYYARLKREQRARAKAYLQAMRLAERERAILAERVQAFMADLQRVPLMLPAPVETIELPGRTQIFTLAELQQRPDAAPAAPPR